MTRECEEINGLRENAARVSIADRDNQEYSMVADSVSRSGEIRGENEGFCTQQGIITISSIRTISCWILQQQHMWSTLQLSCLMSGRCSLVSRAWGKGRQWDKGFWKFKGCVWVQHYECRAWE
jgi:hypothetical protein